MSIEFFNPFTYIYQLCMKPTKMTYYDFLHDERVLVRLNRQIINVEAYLEKEGFFSHPGGTNVLYSRNKSDVSEDYRFHSEKAKKKIQSYAIGYIDGPILKELDIEIGLKQ